MGLWDSLTGGDARRRQHTALIEQGRVLLSRYSVKPSTPRAHIDDDSNFFADVSGVDLEFRAEAFEALEAVSDAVERHDPARLGQPAAIESLMSEIAKLMVIGSKTWTAAQQTGYRARTYGRLFGWAVVLTQGQTTPFLGEAADLANLRQVHSWFPTDSAVSAAEAALRMCFGDATVTRWLADGRTALTSLADSSRAFVMVTAERAKDIMATYEQRLAKH